MESPKEKAKEENQKGDPKRRETVGNGLAVANDCPIHPKSNSSLPDLLKDEVKRKKETMERCFFNGLTKGQII